MAKSVASMSTRMLSTLSCPRFEPALTRTALACKSGRSQRNWHRWNWTALPMTHQLIGVWSARHMQKVSRSKDMAQGS